MTDRAFALDPPAHAAHTEEVAMSAGGLAGLTVIEVADSLGAAFAASMLADYNATVDRLRAAGRLGNTPPRDRRHSMRCAGRYWRATSKSVAADWNNPKNAPLILRLLGQADMLVDRIWRNQSERETPGSHILAKLPENERPLVVGVFPTGADRPDLWPWSRRPEFAGAASGVMALTGHTGKTPIQAEAPLTDYLAGTLAATKALTALRQARLNAEPRGTASSRRRCIRRSSA